MNKRKEIFETIAYVSLLAIICVLSFLLAKYIVRKAIEWKKPPVDVSEKM